MVEAPLCTEKHSPRDNFHKLLKLQSDVVAPLLDGLRLFEIDKSHLGAHQVAPGDFAGSLVCLATELVVVFLQVDVRLLDTLDFVQVEIDVGEGGSHEFLEFFAQFGGLFKSRVFLPRLVK